MRKNRRGWVSFIGMLALVGLTSGAWAGEVVLTYSFTPGDVTLQTTEDGYTRVSLKDGMNPNDAPGMPKLPALFVQALVPAGAKVTGVRVEAEDEMVVAEGVTIYPQQTRLPKSYRGAVAFTQPSSSVYASAEAFPADRAVLQGTGAMRGYTLASVRINPIRYLGAERQLLLIQNLRVAVEYSAPGRLAAAAAAAYPDSGLFRNMVSSLVVNDEAMPTFAPSRKLAGRKAGPTIQYLIITRASLTNAFKDLLSSRSSRFSTAMITVESITNTYAGADAQTKIRACIKNYVTNNATDYVVLGGDNTIVPVRGCYANVDGEIENAMPTDLYYSGLDGSWNGDGDSVYGETGDSVDMNPDVVVARIPVRTTTHASAYINKLINFESNPTRYNGKILLGGMEAWNTYTSSDRPSDNVTNSDHHAAFQYSGHTSVSDSEAWDRRLYRDGIMPYWVASTSIAIFCDTLTTWDTTFGSGNYAQNATNVKNKFNYGWYHMFFSGHGDTTLWGLETGSFSTTEAAAMTGTIVFAYTDACLTGGFDDGEPSLSEAFLRNSGGGALIYMGCSRYGWGEPDAAPASNTSDGGPSTVYGYKFYQRLHETSRLVGDAFAMHKADMISLSGVDGCERWIQFGMNLQGDPVLSMAAIGSQPPAIQSIPAKSVTVSQALSFTVTATDGDGDTVRLYASGLPAGSTFPGATGTVSVSGTFNWTPASTGSYTATFYAGDKDGTNSTIASIAVNPRAKPAIATTPSGASVSTVVNNPFSLTVQATEADGDTVTITNLTLPAWAAFKATNGVAPLQSVMSGTPSVTGAYSAAFRASDADGAVTGTVQIVVTEAPSVIDIGGYRLTQANATYNYTIPADTYIDVNGYVIIARNATKELFESTWGVTLGSDVVYLNSAGSMPVLNGDETYTLYNSSSNLVEGPTPSSLNPSGNSIQRVNATNAATLAESWTSGLASTATPGSGCAGNGTIGLVIGEYADNASYNYEFIELYYDGVAGSETAQAPSISVTGGTNQSVIVSNAISFNVTATDPEGNGVILIADSKPAGSTFTDMEGTSPQASTFSWTPSATGSYQAVFVAADSVDGMETTQRVVITVAPISIGQAPIISIGGSGTSQTVAANAELSFTVTATDPEGHNVILVEDSKPAGSTFTGASGTSPQSDTFLWTPTATGSYAAVFVAADALDGAESTQHVVIVVTSGGSGSLSKFQGFESATNDTWNYTATPGAGQIAVSTDRAAGGTHSLKLSGSNKTNSDPYAVFDNVSLAGITAVQLSVAFSASGPDSDDDLYLDLSYNNGDTWVGEGSVKLVDGYGNCNVAFGSVNAANPTTVTSNPWVVSIPADKTQIKVRIRYDEKSSASNNSDHFYVDNLALTGTAGGGGNSYSNWMADEYDLNPAAPNCGEADDYDGDGISNADEFNMGTSPTNTTAEFSVVDETVVTTNTCTLTIDAQAGRVYSVYLATNLAQANPWALYRRFTNSVGGDQDLILTNSLPSQMYRIGVKAP